MAEDPVSTALIVAVVVVIILTVVTFLELRYFRTIMKRRLAKVDLPDRAHNELLTGKAIATSLRHSGIASSEADDAIAEAEAAYRRSNYRVTIELSEKAKGILKTAKARHDKFGDLARLQKVRSSSSDEPTTKEVLQKEQPQNSMQAKFTISLAEERIAAARDAGRGTVQAEALLRSARASFETQDFDEALKLAVKSRRTADGEVAEAVAGAKAPVPANVEIPRPAHRACASCGSELLAGDTFCRKCGVKVERPTSCPKCGASLKEDDAFCRTCGTTIA